ncbi:hypothetical protein GCM10009764_14510 [Nocardia ninae]|uniref:Uncharacterized protein n=1 Tax=Nocardia ninae NBRC 108245 TaxID=1210091 RepID=A0A511MTR6_9NOCA|nr:hypothetical protein NN4_85120 [Nocardia ninae NBRC 108245]
MRIRITGTGSLVCGRYTSARKIVPSRIAPGTSVSLSTAHFPRPVFGGQAPACPGAPVCVLAASSVSEPGVHPPTKTPTHTSAVSNRPTPIP